MGRPECPPEWVDKMEQRLAVAAAVGAGSHVAGAAPLRLVDDARQRLRAAAGIDAGQPDTLLETQQPADPEPAQLLDENGLVVCLPDPLTVSDVGCAVTSRQFANQRFADSEQRQLRRTAHLEIFQAEVLGLSCPAAIAVEAEWGAPRRPLWDGRDYLCTQQYGPDDNSPHRT